jgi:hypothetical protein
MRQIDALLTQLDAKKRDHFEFVAKELQELQDCGKLSEVVCVFFFFAFAFSVKFFMSLKVSSDEFQLKSLKLSKFASEVLHLLLVLTENSMQSPGAT